MYDNKKEIDIPIEERLMVYPKQRQELFLNLVENYKIFCPNLKMIYAGLNFDSELKMDYLVIFEVDKKGKPFILWDAPFAFTTRSTPAYRYVVREKMHKQFFDECTKHLCQMDKSKFVEFLNSSLCNNLTIDPNSDRYWKHPNNSHSLMKGMTELGLLYVPEGFINKGRRKVD